MDDHEDILAGLFAIEYGEHDLMIYDDIEVFGKIYSKYCKHLLDIKNQVVLLLIFSEEEDRILSNLSKEGIDVDRRRKDGSLLIEDAALDFFGSNFDMFQYFSSLGHYSKSIRKDGLTIILDINALYLLEGEDGEELLKFESSLAQRNHPHQYLKNSSLLCCYHIAVVGKLKDNRQKIMDCHDKIFHALV